MNSDTSTTKTKKKSKKKKKKVLSDKDRIQKKLQSKLHKDLMDTFRYMGFEYIRTEGKHISFGGQKSDFDNVFLYENLIITCEETISLDSYHLRKKYDYIKRVNDSRDEFIIWIKTMGEDKFMRFQNYSNARYQIFHIYTSIETIEEDKRNLFPDFKYIDSKTLNYFKKTADCIKYSARNEFYKFLSLDLNRIGDVTSCQNVPIRSAVIFPEDVTGLPSGVYVVSLVMTAKELLDCSFVFRKESWDEDSGYYYQRLIDKSKILNIRKYLIEKKRTFIDSIIVSLPKDATFCYRDEDGNEKETIDVRKISTIETNTCIKIPYKFNSIGIIDGQHRVYGHHEGPDNKDEQIISNLRKKRHLLVTGIFYQKGMFNELEKRKFESELFLAINSKQKKVSPAILNHINSLQDPLSPIGLAMSIIQKMNGRSPFLNQFIISELDEKRVGIRTPSIVKYGLQGLVEISNNKESLFKYWDDKEKLLLITNPESAQVNEIRKRYISYCSDSICQFFVAVRDSQQNNWNYEKPSKLLTVTCIVAFIRSYENSIEIYNGIKSIPFYIEKLKNLEVDFKAEPFPYVSSQWNKLSEEINKCWR